MSDQTREQPPEPESLAVFRALVEFGEPGSVEAYVSSLLVALDAARQRQRELKQIAQGLVDLDWCIGYELTEANSVALDTLRDRAFAALAQKEPT